MPGLWQYQLLDISCLEAAQAGDVRVSIGLIEEQLQLVVQDDGVGITDLAKAGQPDSHGLQIKRERAEAFGGNLFIESSPERGTHVETHIPSRRQSPCQAGKVNHLLNKFYLAPYEELLSIRHRKL